MQIHNTLAEPFLTACGQIKSAKTRVFKTRDVIYHERPRNKTIVIKRGYVRSIYVQPDGRQWTRMIYGKGSVLGDTPFRPGYFVSDEQLIANGPACLLEIDRSVFEDQASSHPDLQLLLLKTMACQYQFVDRRMHWQLILPLRARIARALEDFMCFAGGRCGHGHLVDVRMTHEEFAQFMVAARPVVSDVLKEFKSAGIIDYTRSHLCLLELDQLHTIARTVQK